MVDWKFWKGKKLEKNVKFKKVFGGVDGEYVLNDLMAYCNFTSTTIADSPHLTYFNEGKREVILYILSELKKSPNELEAMWGNGDNIIETEQEGE